LTRPSRRPGRHWTTCPGWIWGRPAKIRLHWKAPMRRGYDVSPQEEPMKPLAFLALALLSVPASADEIHLKMATRATKGAKAILCDVRGFDKGHFKIYTGGGGGAAGFYSGGGEHPPKITFSMLDYILFDGKKDWWNIELKNGDFVRGEAESAKGGFIRLKGHEKPIRMANVKGIVATEAPKEPTPEPAP